MKRLLALFAFPLISFALLATGCGGPVPEAPKAPEPELGIDVLWYRHPEDSPGTIAAKAARIVRYIDHLGANAISISFPFYMEDQRASRVFSGKATPAPADIAVLIDEAAAQGLSVNVRPLLNQDAIGGWRGAIHPASRNEWFASYERFLAPYLAMASAHRATSFTVGAELSSLAHDSAWNAVDGWARTVFHGSLSFSNNWDAFAADQLGGGTVDQEGVDAYFPVPLDDGASVHDLVTALNVWLSRPRSIHLADIVVQETGIAAQPGSYAHPQAWTGSADRDLRLQSRWYQAMCTVVREHHMAGLYFWDIDFNQNVSRPDPKMDPPLSFIGRDAATAVRSCFAAQTERW